MINKNNYFKHIERIGFENLPLELKQAHTVLMTKSDMGNKWEACEKNTELKNLMLVAFKKLEELIKSRAMDGLDGHITPKSAALSFIKPYFDKGDTMSLHPNFKLFIKTDDYTAKKDGNFVIITSIYGEPIHEVFLIDDILDELTQAISKKKKPAKEKREECLEVKFFRLMLYWNGKFATKSMISAQIEKLQSDIINKRIRKTSPFAKEIMYLQESLIDIYNNMQSHYLEFALKDETVAWLKNAIKESLKMDYKNEPNEENKGSFDLQGIENAEPEVVPQGQIMSSVDFAKMKFESIGFKDKWLNLIGDPSRGFTAMVFGKPKMGKSYLCVDFAGYLARNHGKVLYIAREEKLDATLQKKLCDKDVAHPNLTVSDFLPMDLSEFDFIFIDSVNKMKLSPEDIERLRLDNAGKSFIFVFQTTKEGNFRGTNEFQHDVDVVIEVPEKGKAVQFGRFNQGGEMNIFENQDSINMGNLSGVNKGKAASKTQKSISIETELAIPLGELALELLDKKQPKADIIKLIDSKSSKVESAVKSMAATEIKRSKKNIEVVSVEFAEMDSKNIERGAAYFSVVLKGLKADLRKVAGNDHMFLFDWENGLNGANKSVSWTEPKGLSKKDSDDLKEVNRLFSAKKYKEAMDYASNLDTIVRDEIPSAIWKKMGGKLTPSGEAELKKSKAVKSDKLDESKFANRKDDQNPKYIFSCIDSLLLSEALKGEFDLFLMLRKELANRGLDRDGKWVGFPKAKEIHKV